MDQPTSGFHSMEGFKHLLFGLSEETRGIQHLSGDCGVPNAGML